MDGYPSDSKLHEETSHYLIILVRKAPDLSFLLSVYILGRDKDLDRGFHLERERFTIVPRTPIQANPNYPVKFVWMSSPTAASSVRQPRRRNGTSPVNSSEILPIKIGLIIL